MVFEGTRLPSILHARLPLLLCCPVFLLDFKAFLETIIDQVELFNYESVRILYLGSRVHRVIVKISYLRLVQHEDLDLVRDDVLVLQSLQFVDFDVVQELRELHLKVADHQLVHDCLLILREVQVLPLVVSSADDLPVLLEYFLLDVHSIVQGQLLFVLVEVDALLDVIKQQRVIVRQRCPPVEELILGEHVRYLFLIVKSSYLFIPRVRDFEVYRVPNAEVIQVLLDVCLRFLNSTLAKAALLGCMLAGPLRLPLLLLSKLYLNIMYDSIDVSEPLVLQLVLIFAALLVGHILHLVEHAVDALGCLAFAATLHFLALLQLGQELLDGYLLALNLHVVHRVDARDEELLHHGVQDIHAVFERHAQRIFSEQRDSVDL